MTDIDPKFFLVMRRVRELAEDGSTAAQFAALLAALRQLGSNDPDLEAALELEDRESLQQFLHEWKTSRRKIPEQDAEVFHRAMKAFRKRLKLMRLDDESSIGGGPMSSGRSSGILGIRAPDAYPAEVWLELVYQGRLVDAGDGLYELPSHE